MKLKSFLKALQYIFLTLTLCCGALIVYNSNSTLKTQTSIQQNEIALNLSDQFSSLLGSYQQFFRTFVSMPSAEMRLQIKDYKHKADSTFAELVKQVPQDTAFTNVLIKLKTNYDREQEFITSYVEQVSRNENLNPNAVNESELRMDYVWTDLYEFRDKIKQSTIDHNSLIKNASEQSYALGFGSIGAMAGILVLSSFLDKKTHKLNKSLQLAHTEHLERLKLISFMMDNTTTTMRVVDQQGVIRLANKAFGDMLGLSPEDIIGKQCTQLQLKRDVKFEPPYFTNTPEPEIKEAEEIVYVDGEKRYLHTRKYPFVDGAGQLVASAIISRDVTDRIVIEEGLKKSKKEAEHAKLTQEQFMANISHEIRTPMNGIMGMTDLLTGTELNAEQRDYLEIIQQSSRNLMVLINDILDFSKIEAGMLELEYVPFKVNDIVNQVVGTIGPKAKQKGLTLTQHIDHRVPAYIVGDSLRLYQILSNILVNAVKFTEKGSVELVITAHKFDSPYLKLIFKVTDTGIGIPEERIGYIFQSFAQTSIDISRKFGGTGLGLAIVKQLVEIHGGTIGVESVLGKGSCFTIEIPFVSYTEGVWEGEDTAKFSVLKGKQILVVEDNLINQKVITRTLDNVGVISTVCDNGFKALELLKNQQFDLVIMDIQMPEIDGRETTIRIRKELHLQVPVIAMTASVSADEREKCKTCGMDDYISKPFVKEDLFEKLLLHIA